METGKWDDDCDWDEVGLVVSIDHHHQDGGGLGAGRPGHHHHDGRKGDLIQSWSWAR